MLVYRLVGLSMIGLDMVLSIIAMRVMVLVVVVDKQ
jgi:hypothetical protein